MLEIVNIFDKKVASRLVSQGRLEAEQAVKKGNAMRTAEAAKAAEAVGMMRRLEAEQVVEKGKAMRIAEARAMEIRGLDSTLAMEAAEAAYLIAKDPENKYKMFIKSNIDEINTILNAEITTNIPIKDIDLIAITNFANGLRAIIDPINKNNNYQNQTYFSSNIYEAIKTIFDNNNFFIIVQLLTLTLICWNDFKGEDKSMKRSNLIISNGGIPAKEAKQNILDKLVTMVLPSIKLFLEHYNFYKNNKTIILTSDYGNDSKNVDWLSRYKQEYKNLKIENEELLEFSSSGIKDCKPSIRGNPPGRYYYKDTEKLLYGSPKEKERKGAEYALNNLHYLSDIFFKIIDEKKESLNSVKFIVSGNNNIIKIDKDGNRIFDIDYITTNETMNNIYFEGNKKMTITNTDNADQKIIFELLSVKDEAKYEAIEAINNKIYNNYLKELEDETDYVKVIGFGGETIQGCVISKDNNKILENTFFYKEVIKPTLDDNSSKGGRRSRKKRISTKRRRSTKRRKFTKKNTYIKKKIYKKRKLTKRIR